MNMYTIEVNYTTGNSFNTYEETETVGLVFLGVDQAKVALKALKEHYKEYSQIGLFEKLDEDFYKKKYNWSVDDSGDYIDSLYYCFVECCDGSRRTLPVGSWCGYFETLHSARIIHYDPLSDENDLQVYF